MIKDHRIRLIGLRDARFLLEDILKQSIEEWRDTLEKSDENYQEARGAIKALRELLSDVEKADAIHKHCGQSPSENPQAETGELYIQTR